MRIHPIPSTPTAAGNGNTPLWGSLACDPHKASLPPPEAAIMPAPFIPWLIVSQHLHGASRASAHSDALSAVPPAHDQICFDAASLSFTASMRHPRTHTNIIFNRGTVWIKKKKKRRHCEKINARSGEHSRSSVDGRCLKRWQLSRDSDCLVGFLLHFRTEVAAFVVRATLQCIIHILRRCALHRCYCSTASGTVFPPILASDPCLIGFVKNKEAVWLKANSFVVLFPPFVSRVSPPPHHRCWLNNFSSFAGSLKDKHRIPWVTQLWNAHWLALMHEQTHGCGRREFWLTTLPSPLSLDPCTGAERGLGADEK